MNCNLVIAKDSGLKSLVEAFIASITPDRYIMLFDSMPGVEGAFTFQFNSKEIDQHSEMISYSSEDSTLKFSGPESTFVQFMTFFIDKQNQPIYPSPITAITYK